MVAALVFSCGMLESQPAASAEGPSIVISRPQHDETLHDNTGAVVVTVALQGVTFAAGSRLRVLLDGKPHGADRRARELTLEFTLKGVERGSHSLQVQLIDARDALIATSPTVTFHLWQASTLLPPRKPPPPPAPGKT